MTTPKKTGFARKPEVREFTGLPDSTREREQDAGKFPLPYRITSTTIGWKWSEIYAWADGLNRADPSVRVGRGGEAA